MSSLTQIDHDVSKEMREEFIAARDLLQSARLDYESARSTFEWPTFTHFNWALDYFDHIAAREDRLALWIVHEDGREEKRRFSELTASSNRAANWLRALGIGRGDRILLMLPNVLPLWELTLAAIKIGAVLIPASTLLAGDDLVDRNRRGRVKAVITLSDHCAKFDVVAGSYVKISVGEPVAGWVRYECAEAASAVYRPDGPTRASDPLFLYFTSGTTALPKLVMHTHSSYPIGHLTTMYWLGLKPGDLHCNISSPGWAKHAWSNVFAPWNAESTVFVYNFSRFSPAAALDTLTRCGVTTLCAPPTVWRMLIQEDLTKWPVSLREAASAGEPLNPEVISQIQAAWGVTVRDGFGQSETTAQIGNSPGQTVKIGSMGRPLPGCPIVLLDEHGREAEEGEIAVRLADGPCGIMAGYQTPDDGLVPLTGSYFRTGDIASRDEDGYYTYVGRADDVFKASDYRISPFELESVLLEHEAVAEAAVVPSPDALRQNVPKAFVALAPGFAASRDVARDICRHASARLAPYKRIRRIEFIDLPKTISGKIRRVDLRRRELDRGAAGVDDREFREADLEL